MKIKRGPLKPGLKQYILLLTLLPSLLITTVLTAYLIVTRQADAQDELVRQGSSSIAYLSKVSELDFFSGDKDALRRLAQAAIANDDVKSVSFYDFKQAEILTVGEASGNHPIHLETTFFKEERGSQWIFQMPVIKPQINVSDFEAVEDMADAPVEFLGWVQIIADKSRLQERQQSILLAGATIGLLGFSLLAFLALKFSQSITLPLDSVTSTVKQLERGDLSARVKVSAKGELEELTQGINRLAEKVEISKQSLQKRVQSATKKLTQTLNVLELKNQELEKTGKEIIAANKSKDDFLARVSHELRTPLTSILGYSRLLKKEKLPVEQIDQVNIIYQASTLLLALIDDILDFSKFQSRSIELESKSFSLQSLLEEVLDLHLYIANEKGVDLLLTLEPDVPLNLIGDELRIKQIITNLLCNALKFTQQGEVIMLVSLLQQEGGFGLRFIIKDTGIGISKEEMSHIFQPFYQADASISRRFGGTGLGLVICEKLVHLLGGEISLSSNKNEGTEVTFTLLNIERQTAEGQKYLESAKKAVLINIDKNTDKNSDNKLGEHKKSMPLSNVTVLLAEDNFFNKKLLVNILKAGGANVISADNGKIALEKCLAHAPDIDLIIMDYHMPVMDGLKASEMIRKSFSSNDMPILFLTADINISNSDLYDKGIDRVIHKPVNEEELLQSVILYAGQSTASLNKPLIHGKVLDFLPDEIILKEIKRLTKLLQQAFSAKHDKKMKKYAHELCGVAGPTSKFGSFEGLARKLEKEINLENHEQISVLLEELATEQKLGAEQLNVKNS